MQCVLYELWQHEGGAPSTLHRITCLLFEVGFWGNFWYGPKRPLFAIFVFYICCHSRACGNFDLLNNRNALEFATFTLHSTKSIASHFLGKWRGRLRYAYLPRSWEVALFDFG